MCGRFTVGVPREELVDEFGVSEPPFDIRPRYNLAPTQIAPVVLRGDDGGLSLAGFRWGLVPFWARDEQMGNRLINARAESLDRRPAFRWAFRQRRCLVPADGWYEWRREGPGRVPMWIHLRSRRPFAFAGLWERWGPREAPVHTFAIVSTDAAPGIRDIHDRMPAVLPRDLRDRWLDPRADPRELLSLLRPYPGDDLEAWPVSRLVNSPDNDVEECILPAEDVAPASARGGKRPDDQQISLL